MGSTNKNSRAMALLKCLFIGGAVVISLTSPYAGHRMMKELIHLYTRKRKFQRARLLQDLKRLQNREIIDYTELDNGEIKIVLAGKGKKLQIQFNFDTLSLSKKEPWDKTWRMVIFDIPEDKRRAREAFRQKLQQLGLYPIQKSVFIVPYRCENEVEFAATVLEVRQHILLFLVASFEGEEKMREYFGVQ